MMRQEQHNSVQLTIVPVFPSPVLQFQLTPVSLIVLEESFLGGRDPHREACSKAVEDDAPPPSPRAHPSQFPLNFQGDVVELGDPGTLAPKCPHIQAADALLVYHPVFLWEMTKSTS